MAYKKNTGDIRESPGTVIAQSLSALGADVGSLTRTRPPGTTALPMSS